MLKLNAVYALEGKVLDLREWVLRQEWLPEVGSNIERGEVLDVLQAEGRLQLREHVNDYIDGYRVMELMTLWFDGKPVLIAQAAGRSGRDHSKRWITDATLYAELLAYVFSKAPFDPDHTAIVDGETLVYEEDVFDLNGTDVGARFGYPRETRQAGYTLFVHASQIVATARPDQVLVMLRKGVEPAAFIRRGACVLALERDISPQELASNERLAKSLEGDEHDRYVWYRTAPRPADQVVVSV